MKEIPLISVIVPVYNVEKYIEKCILSLVEQTYENYEVIIVDDGSLDCSIALAKAVIQSDKRFKIVTQKNGGLSSARNFGVKQSKGYYISFLDSDDYFSPDFLQKMVFNLTNNDADIVVCSMYLVDESYNVLEKRGPNKSSVITGEEAFLDNLFTKSITSGAQNKLYRRSLVLKYPYPLGLYYEDRATTYKMFLDSKRVYLSPEPLFFYLQRTGSIMKSLSKKSIDDRFTVFESIEKELLTRNLFKKYSNHYKASFLLNVVLAGSFQIAKFSSNYSEDITYLFSKVHCKPLTIRSLSIFAINQPKKFIALCLLLLSKSKFKRIVNNET
ncbi:glycosyltransferase family 2 protein [Vibrio harveyi]|uniref:glycosyltransferase family 2 protein n=1 Tax=Vibrio harveyi TaxID=669 RepID=UPI003CF880A9